MAIIDPPDVLEMISFEGFRERIAKRAYFRAEAEGFAEGRDLPNWVTAEEEQLRDTGPDVSKDDLRARIAARAYFIALAEGFPDGRALDHWIAAERAEYQALLLSVIAAVVEAKPNGALSAAVLSETSSEHEPSYPGMFTRSPLALTGEQSLLLGVKELAPSQSTLETKRTPVSVHHSVIELLCPGLEEQ